MTKTEVMRGIISSREKEKLKLEKSIKRINIIYTIVYIAMFVFLEYSIFNLGEIKNESGESVGNIYAVAAIALVVSFLVWLVLKFNFGECCVSIDAKLEYEIQDRWWRYFIVLFLTLMGIMLLSVSYGIDPHPLATEMIADVTVSGNTFTVCVGFIYWAMVILSLIAHFACVLFYTSETRLRKYVSKIQSELRTFAGEDLSYEVAKNIACIYSGVYYLEKGIPCSFSTDDIIEKLEANPNMTIKEGYFKIKQEAEDQAREKYRKEEEERWERELERASYEPSTEEKLLDEISDLKYEASKLNDQLKDLKDELDRYK